VTYEKADLDFIWLGEAAWDDYVGLGLVEHICDLLDETFLANSEPPDLSAPGLTSIPSELWPAMIAMFTQPWLYRAWVVQEYCRSRKYIFRCRALVIPSDILLGLSHRMSNYYHLRVLTPMLCAPILKMASFLDRSFNSWGFLQEKFPSSTFYQELLV
jgi:hypothetical protein